MGEKGVREAVALRRRPASRRPSPGLCSRSVLARRSESAACASGTASP
ncbi:hypothetical protein ABZY90_21890 [Streptomyces sp. NPDC006422]